MMSQSHDDIEEVTRQLQEAEKDLELTAQIGKKLLEENQHLKKHIEELENDVRETNEYCSQLKYELNTKCNILATLTKDGDDEDDFDILQSKEDSVRTSLSSVDYNLLQERVFKLQNENRALRDEATELVKETTEYEETERQLLDSFRDELNSTKDQLLVQDYLIDELVRLKDENEEKTESIDKLTSNLNEVHLQMQELTSDCDELTNQLRDTKDNQNALAMELAGSKERYQEVLSMLKEAQQELRKERKRRLSPVQRSLTPAFAQLPCSLGESLHSELMQSSLASNFSLDSGIQSERGSADHAEGKPFGASAPKVLTESTQRLSSKETLIRRQNSEAENLYEECKPYLQNAPREDDGSKAAKSLPNSLGYLSNRPWHKKLEFVKLFEGSNTLNRWNKLATPTIDGLLDERPGVAIRGVQRLKQLKMPTASDSSQSQSHQSTDTSTVPYHRKNSSPTESASEELVSLLSSSGITSSSLSIPSSEKSSFSFTSRYSSEFSYGRNRSHLPPPLTGLLYSLGAIIRRNLFNCYGDRSLDWNKKNSALTHEMCFISAADEVDENYWLGKCIPNYQPVVINAPAIRREKTSVIN